MINFSFLKIKNDLKLVLRNNKDFLKACKGKEDGSLGRLLLKE